MSFSIFLTLFALLYIYIQFCLLGRVEDLVGTFNLGEGKRRNLIRLITAFFILINGPIIFLFFPLLRLSSYELPEVLIYTILYPFSVWSVGSLGAFLFLMVFDILVFISSLIYGKTKEPTVDKEPDLSRRNFIKIASNALIAIPMAGSVYGAVGEKEDYKIERIKIPVKDLPESLNGLTICQLTDIHLDVFFKPEDFERVIYMVEGLKPDLVFLTGDYVTSQPKLAKPCVEVLSRLKPEFGMYGCLGNHEIYARTEEIFTREFAKKGVKILRNESVELSIKGEKLTLMGIDFIRFMDGTIKRLMNGKSLRKNPVILLSHHPNAFVEAASSGVGLTLAGHTHGGQIALKIGSITLALARLITPYLSGLFKKGDSYLYVSRGIGTTGPPIRLNAPPEITVVELVGSSESSSDFSS